MSFYTIQCFNCGKWQSCEVKNINKYVFKCRRCNKSKKFKQKSYLVINSRGPFSKDYVCVQVTQILNLKKKGDK